MSGPFGSTAWMYATASGFYDFPISNSLRFEDGDTAYLSYTPDAAGNQRTWTYSLWAKRCNLGRQDLLLGNAGGDLFFEFQLTSSDDLQVYYHEETLLVSDAKLRDSSAWYHIVVRHDTTQGTANNRLRFYLNGAEVTSFSTNGRANLPQNFQGGVNSAVAHHIGANQTPGNYYDGYLAEINFIDGTSLGPDSFGETKNDIWIPKDTADLTFGDEGYRLQFKQTGTSQNSSGIGADTSGNNNHWAVNNLVASDVVPDSPTNILATLNSNAPDTTGATNHSFSEGNLKVSTGANSWWNAFGTIGMSSGKYYWEYYALGSGDVDQNIGVCTLDWYRGSNAGADSADAYSLYAASDGNGYLYTDGASAVDKGTGYCWTHADIMSVAFDADTGKIWYAKNGTFLGSGDPAAGSNVAHTVTAGDLAKGMLPVFTGYHTAATPMINFGQDSSFAGNETAQGNKDGNGKGDFYYSPPSGYLSLSTFSLPDPVATVDPNKGGSPQDHFNTVLYTGNAGTQNITGVGFQPDWVWLKPRSYADNHVLFDSVRGVNQTLYANTSGAEADRTGNDSLTAFGSDGFSIGDWNNINTNNGTLVSWNWKAGTAFSNDASSTGVGSIDSAGSVNTDVGFSIIGYTGTATIGTIAHGLSSAPDMLIVKNRSATEPLATYHSSLGAHFGTYLSESATPYDLNIYWNDTEPTSSVFTVNTHTIVNANTNSMIAYCFHEVEGYSKFGKYTGNGNADGTFVYTGFRPAWFMIKRTDSAGSWSIHDTARDTFNVTQKNLYANLDAGEESQATWQYDILSNGIKLIGTSGEINASGGTYIYMAFAEQPFKYANAR